MSTTLRSIMASLLLAATLSLGASAKLLTGEVEHSDRLAPLDPALAPGQIFDPDKLTVPDSQGINNWYRIPAWLAGTWHKDSQTDYYRLDYKTKAIDTTTRTETARADGTWGTQQDDKGNIWQFDPAPFNATVDSGDDFVVQMVHESEPIQVDDQRFVRRSVDTQIRVAKANSVIQSVETGEQITVYTPENDGLLKRDTSAKVFDNAGEPVLLGKSFAYEKRLSPFVPQNLYKGRDMKMLFQQFMKTASESASTKESATTNQSE